MQKYFDVFLEFDHRKSEETIIKTSITGKGYCCFVDHTLLVTAYREKNGKLKNILNNALVNFCDGSYIAIMASKIYNTDLKAYNGPELFNKFIYHSGKQCIVGNTQEVFHKIRLKLNASGIDTSDLFYIPVPYVNVDQFDYPSIANKINTIEPRYIWLSLGAPKQEEFMYKILPHISKGVMLGIGAALNYFSGEIRDIPEWAKKMHLIWLYRVFTEPKKQIPRCLNTFKTYPLLYFKERIRVKKLNITTAKKLKF